MPRRRRPGSPTWRTFLKNHVKDLVALDFFVVPNTRTLNGSSARFVVSAWIT
jgi:hypothetical protein